MEQSRADRGWPWAERHGMERELYYALADPWVTNTTTRLLDALLNSKITTRAQIIALGVDGLSRVRNLGPKGIAYIRQRLMPTSQSEALKTIREDIAKWSYLRDNGQPITSGEYDSALTHASRLLAHLDVVTRELDAARAEIRRVNDYITGCLT